MEALDRRFTGLYEEALLSAVQGNSLLMEFTRSQSTGSWSLDTDEDPAAEHRCGRHENEREISQRQEVITLFEELCELADKLKTVYFGGEVGSDL